jgi:predicted amidohydrolase YtcJ
VLVTASSDFPVTYPPNPLVAIETGITRSLPGISDPLWQEEAATLEQMITAYTVNGAKANLLENETGSLEVGKSADFIILDRNLFSIPATEIRDARVLRTFFRGKEVYSATN